MTESNFDIKLKDHYKLYVLLKDKITFESELQKNGIKYYADIKEQPFIENGIRYFLLDSDREKIDRIITEKGIVANVEFYNIRDFRDQKKIIKMYLIAVAVVLGIIILFVLIKKLLE